jgi:hypothetical protein
MDVPWGLHPDVSTFHYFILKEFSLEERNEEPNSAMTNRSGGNRFGGSICS